VKVDYVKNIWDYAYVSSLLQMMLALELHNYHRWESYIDFYGDFSYMRVF